jgi:hypothetical protein
MRAQFTVDLYALEALVPKIQHATKLTIRFPVALKHMEVATNEMSGEQKGNGSEENALEAARKVILPPSAHTLGTFFAKLHHLDIDFPLIRTRWDVNDSDEEDESYDRGSSFVVWIFNSR